MSTVTNSLLDLILNLLSNDDELKKFEANPEKFVAEAGYEGCEDDVKDAVKMAGDMRSHNYGAEKAAPAAKAEHADYQAVSHVAPKHAERDDHKDYADKDDKDDKDRDDYDGPRHVEHVTHNHNHDVDNVTNNHYTTNNIDKTHNGDTYDIWADEGAQVALNGGLNFGDDAEFEGDFEYKPEDSFNEATVGGDGVAAANGDVDLENAFNDNHNEGSGVLVGGNVEGDVDNNHADNGSIAGEGNRIDNSIDIDATIDASTSDDDVIVKDNVAQFGENNINDAELKAVNVDTNASAAAGEEAEVEEVLTLDLGTPEIIPFAAEEQPAL